MKSEPKALQVLCNYGSVDIHLREIMEQKGISRYQLARLTNTRFEVVNKWYQGHVERIDADILARFCFCLGCSVADLIQYHI